MAIFLLIALPLAYVGRGEHSAYLLTFSSFPGGQATFGLFGGNYILGDVPLMAENEHYIKQILMFNGDPNSLSLHFTATRPVYGFLASLVAPVFGVIGSQVFLNLLAWAAAVYVSWRFSVKLFGDTLVALIASVLTSGGLGFVLHSHDYSPHLVPFAMYYAVTLLIYESGVWNAARPLRVHLTLGVCLAIACLTYTTGFPLVMAYVVVALWRNRWWHVAAATVVALTSHLIYTAGLNLTNSWLARSFTWQAIDGAESDKLQKSLDIWAAQLSKPTDFVAMVLNGLGQFSFFEFPLIVALGLASWAMLPRRWAVWRFFLAFFAIPIVGGMAYLNYSTTRGYVIYGISLLIYVPLAAMFGKGLRARSRSVVVGAAIGLAVTLTIQLLWSSGFVWGYAVPAKTFFGFGYLNWIPQYIWQFRPPPAISLTGLELTPTLFGGAVSMVSAGMASAVGDPHVVFRSGIALMSRAVLVGYVAVLAFLITSGRQRVLAVGGVIFGLAVVPVLLAKVFPPAKPALMSTFYTTVVPPRTTLRYQVDLSDVLVDKLREYGARAVKVQFVTSGIHAPFDVRVSDGQGTILAESHEGGMLQDAKVSVAGVLETLDRSRHLELAITAFEAGKGASFGTGVFGWQRNGLPGRKLSNAATGAAWEGPLLPALEIRLLDGQGRAVFIGF